MVKFDVKSIANRLRLQRNSIAFSRRQSFGKLFMRNLGAAGIKNMKTLAAQIQDQGFEELKTHIPFKQLIQINIRIVF